MKVLVIVVALAAGYYAGYTDLSGPVDNTGRDSIVIEFDNDGWCELRGPARFNVFDAFAKVYKEVD